MKKINRLFFGMAFLSLLMCASCSNTSFEQVTLKSPISPFESDKVPLLCGNESEDIQFDGYDVGVDTLLFDHQTTKL